MRRSSSTRSTPAAKVELSRHARAFKLAARRYKLALKNASSGGARADYRCGAVLYAELGVEVLQVFLHGARPDPEDRADLRVALGS